MSRADDIFAVVELVNNFGLGITEIRRKFPAGSADRLYFATVVDAYCQLQSNKRTISKDERNSWKKVAFVERMTSQRVIDGERNPNWLSFDAFDEKAFRGNPETNDLPMGLMCETTDKFERESKRRSTRGLKSLKRPTISDVKVWIDENMKRYSESGLSDELPGELDRPRDPNDSSSFINVRTRYHG